MKSLWKSVKALFLLSLGAAFVLYVITYIDVHARLEYWASGPGYPDMDPRVMYSFALLGLVVAATVSGFIELVRAWVFERRVLAWWQLVVVGASYPVYFSGLSLRHFMEVNQANLTAIVLAIIINPITVYWLFNGYTEETKA